MNDMLHTAEVLERARAAELRRTNEILRRQAEQASDAPQTPAAASAHRHGVASWLHRARRSSYVPAAR